MPKFVVNKPIESDQPVITVEGTLPPGSYIFELVVEDQNGVRSDPTEVEVRITQTIPPPIHPPIPPVGGGHT